MATSKVQIASNALLLLGDKPINSFDEDSDRALIASNLWDNAAAAVLRAHPWNCATNRVALAPDTDAPAYDWSYQYTMPGDLLRVLFVGQAGAADAYKIEGRKILSDENPLYLEYVFNNEDVASWDAMLVEAMTRYMAYLMAYPLTKSNTTQDTMHQGYQNALKLARTIDGQENPPEDAGDYPLISARGI
jgi:hypothetical protein